MVDLCILAQFAIYRQEIGAESVDGSFPDLSHKKKHDQSNSDSDEVSSNIQGEKLEIDIQSTEDRSSSGDKERYTYVSGHYSEQAISEV